MWFARNATVTTMSSNPCRASSRTMCSIIGWLTTGIIGFGWLLVSGRNRVPSPPAKITAFMASWSSYSDDPLRARGAPFAQCDARCGYVLRRRVVPERHTADREPPRTNSPHDFPRTVDVVGEQEQRQREHQRKC